MIFQINAPGGLQPTAVMHQQPDTRQRDRNVETKPALRIEAFRRGRLRDQERRQRNKSDPPRHDREVETVASRAQRELERDQTKSFLDEAGLVLAGREPAPKPCAAEI